MCIRDRDKYMIQFNTIPEALEDLRQGKLILVTDDPERENEGEMCIRDSLRCYYGIQKNQRPKRRFG